MQQERPVRVAGRTLGRERHICALFNNRDEEHRVLRSFFTEGLDRGDKAVHVVGPEQRHQQEDPFFVPPDQILLELRERGAAGQGTRRLH